jgi:hypothetical protein
MTGEIAYWVWGNSKFVVPETLTIDRGEAESSQDREDNKLAIPEYTVYKYFIILGRNYSKMFITWTWPWLDSFLNEAKTLNRGKIWARGPVATPDAPKKFWLLN